MTHVDDMHDAASILNPADPQLISFAPTVPYEP